VSDWAYYFALFATVHFLWPGVVQADEHRIGAFSPFMQVHGYAKPPVGHMHFCNRNPQECQAGPVNNSRIQLTPSLWSDLEQINYIVNRTVVPRSDHELYGLSEHWTFPYRSGDCEDYVLLKRRMLLERGWPKSALLITVVRDETRGHAVLIARTSRGDYLLDNKRNTVVAWYDAPYQYLKRQSYRHPRRWVSLVPKNKKKGFSTGGTTRR